MEIDLVFLQWNPFCTLAIISFDGREWHVLLLRCLSHAFSRMPDNPKEPKQFETQTPKLRVPGIHGRNGTALSLPVTQLCSSFLLLCRRAYIWTPGSLWGWTQFFFFFKSWVSLSFLFMYLQIQFSSRAALPSNILLLFFFFFWWLLLKKEKAFFLKAGNKTCSRDAGKHLLRK